MEEDNNELVYHSMSIRLGKTQYKKIKQAAKDDNRTISAFVRTIIIKHLEHERKR